MKGKDHGRDTSRRQGQWSRKKHQVLSGAVAGKSLDEEKALESEIHLRE